MKNNVFAGALVAVGLFFAGLFIYLGINNFASKDRVVSVKGLSTREVEADYAVWPLAYAWSGNDLPSLYSQLERVTERVKKHLLSLGFEESDIRQGAISVEDNWSNYYGERRPEYKYTLSSSLIVSTNKVQLVVASQGKEAELLKEGIHSGCRSVPDYGYTVCLNGFGGSHLIGIVNLIQEILINDIISIQDDNCIIDFELREIQNGILQ